MSTPRWHLYKLAAIWTCICTLKLGDTPCEGSTSPVASSGRLSALITFCLDCGLLFLGTAYLRRHNIFVSSPLRLGTFNYGWILVGHWARLGAALSFLRYTRSHFCLVRMCDTKGVLGKALEKVQTFPFSAEGGLIIRRFGTTGLDWDSRAFPAWSSRTCEASVCEVGTGAQRSQAFTYCSSM